MLHSKTPKVGYLCFTLQCFHLSGATYIGQQRLSQIVARLDRLRLLLIIPLQTFSLSGKAASL